jgi:hypothetical protein
LASYSVSIRRQLFFMRVFKIQVRAAPELEAEIAAAAATLPK